MRPIVYEPSLVAFACLQGSTSAQVVGVAVLFIAQAPVGNMEQTCDGGISLALCPLKIYHPCHQGASLHDKMGGTSW